MAFLTDRTLATGVTLQDLIHIVITGDTSQNPAGSSYKATIEQVLSNVTLPTGYWTSGSTGTDSIKSINSTGLDATGDRAVAWGNGTLASGDNSTASGDGSIASGLTSYAEGFQTVAGGFWSHSEGRLSSALGNISHAEGAQTLANGDSSHSEGSSTTAFGDYSHSEGYQTITSGTSSHAEGANTITIGYASHAEGDNTVASGDGSHSEGQYTTASGDGSHTEGYQSISSGFASHAEGGYYNGFFYFSGGSATGIGSHSEGAGTLASGDYSHSEGVLTQALGDYSHAEGDSTIASTLRSHAEGYYSLAANQGAHAEGGYYDGFNIISGGTATGLGSHAEGALTIANGSQSHAGGYNSTADGATSFIHSTDSLVSGNRSVVIGGQNITGTTDDTVYVPYLNISLIGGSTPNFNLGLDSNGFVVTGTTSTNFTGGIVTGETIFSSGLSATTISATTIGTNTDCVDDLYVYNIHSCSPLNINPLDEGNVYFGSNSGITIDLANERLGVGTSSPQYPLQIVGTNSQFYYDPTSSGGRFNIFSTTGLPRFDVTITSNGILQPATGGSVGMRTWTDTLSPGYGSVGDMFIYAGANTKNLNIINAPAGVAVPIDNIRFYAGTTPDLSTAHMYIDGSGSNKGFVGIGLETPSERLHVSGNTIITGNARIGGPNNTYSSIVPSLSVGPNNEFGVYSESASLENNIQLRSGSAASFLKLTNGLTSPRLSTALTQYNTYSALEVNSSTGTTSATFYIVNQSEGPITFRTSGVNDTLYLLPSGDTLSVFSGTNTPVIFVTNYLEAENIALRSVGTSAFVNDIRIDANGKLTTNTSDERLKENVKPITNGLNTILQLSGVTYQWKDRNAGGNDERFGFIAQQVEAVDSRLSFTNKVDEYKGVHTDAIIPLLVEAMKEQQATIEELKNRISILENLNK